MNPHLKRLEESLAHLRATPLLGKVQAAELVAVATLNVLRDFEARLVMIERDQVALWASPPPAGDD